MSIDEIVKKSIIGFPWSLSLEQSKSLIKYIAIKLNANIRYDYSQHIDVGFKSGYVGFLEKERVSGIGGQITLPNPPFTFDHFKFNLSKQEESKLSSIQFQLIVDSEPSDYRPEVVQLWDNVRKAVADYFEENDEVEVKNRD